MGGDKEMGFEGVWWPLFIVMGVLSGWVDVCRGFVCGSWPTD